MDLKKYFLGLSIPFLLININSFSQNYEKFVLKEKKDIIYFKNKYKMAKDEQTFFVDTNSRKNEKNVDKKSLIDIEYVTSKDKENLGKIKDTIYVSADTTYINNKNEYYLEKIIKQYEKGLQKKLDLKDFNELCYYIDEDQIGNHNKILDRKEIRCKVLEAKIWEERDFVKRVKKFTKNRK